VRPESYCCSALFCPLCVPLFSPVLSVRCAMCCALCSVHCALRFPLCAVHCALSSASFVVALSQAWSMQPYSVAIGELVSAQRRGVASGPAIAAKTEVKTGGDVAIRVGDEKKGDGADGTVPFESGLEKWASTVYFNGFYYTLTSAAVGFWEAEREARARGGQLVSIRSWEEQRFLEQWLETVAPQKSLWLGAITNTAYQFDRWLDGHPMDFQIFAGDIYPHSVDSYSIGKPEHQSILYMAEMSGSSATTPRAWRPLRQARTNDVKFGIIKIPRAACRFQAFRFRATQSVDLTELPNGQALTLPPKLTDDRIRGTHSPRHTAQDGTVTGLPL
jgi:hypothetical protein